MLLSLLRAIHHSFNGVKDFWSEKCATAIKHHLCWVFGCLLYVNGLKKFLMWSPDVVEPVPLNFKMCFIIRNPVQSLYSCAQDIPTFFILDVKNSFLTRNNSNFKIRQCMIGPVHETDLSSPLVFLEAIILILQIRASFPGLVFLFSLQRLPLSWRVCGLHAKEY